MMKYEPVITSLELKFERKLGMLIKSKCERSQSWRMPRFRGAVEIMRTGPRLIDLLLNFSL